MVQQGGSNNRIGFYVFRVPALADLPDLIARLNDIVQKGGLTPHR
jgi:hypothetical protein